MGAIVIRDLLMGDVWLASGQSNMELPLLGFPCSAALKNGPEEIKAANHPEIRLLHEPKFAPCAFIAETPVDSPGDEARNVGVLRALSAGLRHSMKPRPGARRTSLTSSTRHSSWPPVSTPCR